MKKISVFLILLILIQGCGFTPIYLTNKNTNFIIKNTSYQGDQELNSFINLNLNRYNSNKASTEKTLRISIKTNYEKNPQTKDTKGNTSLFRITGTVHFDVTDQDGKVYKFQYNEQSDLNNSNDTFDLNTHERSIKQNFASSMVEKLVFDLTNIQ